MRRGTFILAIALALAIAPAADASFPGKRGRIAFSRETPTGSYVYTVKPNGKGGKRLPCTAIDTDGKCADSGPSWSRDGKRLVFENAKGFAIVKANGSGLQQVLLPPVGGEALEPVGAAFFPNGTRLAFEASTAETDTAGRPGDIYTVNTDGTGLKDIAREAFSPAVSIKSKVAFGAGGVFVHRTGKKPIIVSGNEDNDEPDWAPGGTRVLYSCNSFREICDRKASGKGKQRRIVKARKSDKRQRSDAVWSPDAKYIAYQRHNKGDTSDVLVFNRKTRHTKTIRNAEQPSWQPAG